VWLDCDVIQADGGTRTASITGAFVAMALALGRAVEEEKLTNYPIRDYLAATSVGVDVEHGTILDLNYEEDSNIEVDMNIVMTSKGQFVELQGTGEEATFSKEQFDEMLELASKGISDLVAVQKEALSEFSHLLESEGEEV
jgi:ribonuclease PH